MTNVANRASPEIIEAMRKELRFRPHTPAWRRDVAKRYCATEAQVESLEEELDHFILESAPAGVNPKGSTMSINDTKAHALARIVREQPEHRAVPVAARILGCTEAEARTAVRTIREAAARGANRITESDVAPTAPSTERPDHRTVLAERFAEDLQSSLAKPLHEASLTDLENIAAAGNWI